MRKCWIKCSLRWLWAPFSSICLISRTNIRVMKHVSERHLGAVSPTQDNSSSNISGFIWRPLTTVNLLLVENDHPTLGQLAGWNFSLSWTWTFHQLVLVNNSTIASSSYNDVSFSEMWNIFTFFSLHRTLWGRYPSPYYLNTTAGGEEAWRTYLGYQSPVGKVWKHLALFIPVEGAFEYCTYFAIWDKMKNALSSLCQPPITGDGFPQLLPSRQGLWCFPPLSSPFSMSLLKSIPQQIQGTV